MMILFIFGSMAVIPMAEFEGDHRSTAVMQPLDRMEGGSNVEAPNADGNTIVNGHVNAETPPTTRADPANASGGSWFQTGRNDFIPCLKNGVTVTGYGTDGRVNLTLVDDEGWGEITLNHHPVAMYGQKMVYDSVNRKMVMFGGRTYTGASSSQTWLYDTSRNAWTRVQPSSSPNARYYHGMAFDSSESKVVMFGGYWVGSETWVYDVGGNEWTQRYPDAHPRSVYGHGMTYDSDNDKIVLFGGMIYSGGWRRWNETWIYDLSANTWTRMYPPVTPSPRYYHDMVYDPVIKKVVLFGGNDGHYKRDTWTYDVTTNVWTEVERNSPPNARQYPAMVFDDEVGKVMLYGGHHYDYDVWLYDGTGQTWTKKVYPERPYRRHSVAMAHDSHNGKTIMFGGYHNYMEDTWAYDHYRHTSTGTLTSPLISLPEGMKWSRLHVDKTELVGTFINITVVDATTSAPVPGFDNLPNSRTDLSSLNGKGINSIRLVANFKGPGDRSPVLHSWGLEWRTADGWHMGFSGEGDIRRTPRHDNGTCAHWNLDESEGQLALDASPEGNHGRLGGGINEEPGDPEWVEGRSGSALRFDGRDDFVWVDRTDALSPDEALTVELWFLADSPGRRMTLISSRADGDYALEILPNGSIRALLSTINMDPDMYNELYSRTTVRSHQWHHVALTFRRPHIRLYVDGREEAALEADFQIRHSIVPLFLGADVGSAHFPYEPTNFFAGIIDDVHISRRARGPDEISMDSVAGLSLHRGKAELAPNSPAAGASTIFHYPFSEVNSTFIRNLGPLRIPGILYGPRRLGEGLHGNALRFNGTSPVIRVNDCAQTHPQNATYEFWIKCISHSGHRVLFAEERGGGTGMNEEGFIDSEGRPHYLFDDGTWDIVASDALPLDSWVHLAFVRSGNTASIFVDGEKRGEGTFSDFEPALSEPLYIGGSGMAGGSFEGLMDEVLLTGRALSEDEIGERAKLFSTGTSFVTETVELPIPGGRRGDGAFPDHTWSSFIVESQTDDNNTLNITLYDNATGEPILNVRPNSTFLRENLTHLNSLEHSGIYAGIEVSGDGSDTPGLLSIGLRWDPVESPRLTEEIPEQFIIREDEVGINITNLSSLFEDAYTHISPPVYRIERNTDPGNVTLAFNGSTLVIAGITENWTGGITASVNCTNVYGRSRTSNIFTILVLEVDDRPVWRTRPPVIELKEDTNLTLEDYFAPHVFDVENSEVEFSVQSEDENISVMLLEPDVLFIEPGKDYFGSSNITVTVFEPMEPTLFSNVTVTVEVGPVNDPPVTTLLSPAHNSILTETTVDFRWDVTDIDSELDEITYDFYISKAGSTVPFMSDLLVSHLELDDLEDGTTYYWRAIPRDGESKGTCANGTWSFALNSTVNIPEAIQISPLNGTVTNLTTVNLSWKPRSESMYGVTYRLYLGSSPGNLTEHARTSETWITLSGLSDDTTYYWWVLPFLSDIEGTNPRGPWSFSVQSSFVARGELSMELEKERINMTQGDNATFGITLANTGNIPVLVEMKVRSLLLHYIVLEAETYVPLNGTITIEGRIVNTDLLEARSYSVKVEAMFEGGSSSREMTVNIIPDRAETPEEKENVENKLDWWVVWVFGAGFLLVILVFLIFIMRMRRRYRKELEKRDVKEELELLDAEIVTPATLPSSPPPQLPGMESRQALPQFSGPATQVRMRETAQKLPQRHFTGTVDAAPPPQLPERGGMYAQPPAGAEPPVPPPPVHGGPAPVPRPSPVPAPSVVVPDMGVEKAPDQELKKLPPAPPSGIEVPRIHVPVRGRKGAERPQQRGPEKPRMPPSAPEPATPPQVESASDYIPPGSSEQPKVPEPETEPPASPQVPAVHKPETPVVIETDEPSEASVLDSLSALLQNMPENLEGKEK